MTISSAGIAVGSPVINGNSNCVLYLSNTGTLANNTNFTYDPTNGAFNLGYTVASVFTSILQNSVSTQSTQLGNNNFIDLNDSTNNITAHVGSNFIIKNTSGSSLINVANDGSTIIDGTLTVHTSNAWAIQNDIYGQGLMLRGTGPGTFGQLRVISNGGGWSDAQNTTYFQMMNGSNNNATFMGGTFGTDAQLDRLQFNSYYTTITDSFYTNTPVPTAILELAGSSGSKPLLKLSTSSIQTANYIEIFDDSNNPILVFDASNNLNIASNIFTSAALGTGGFVANTQQLVTGGFTGSAIVGAYANFYGNTNGGSGIVLPGGAEIIIDARNGLAKFNAGYFNGSTWTPMMLLGSDGSIVFPSLSSGLLQSDVSGNISITAISALLDNISSTQGAILYRNATDWVALAPGSAGQIFQTNGSSADPSWVYNTGGVIRFETLDQDFTDVSNSSGETYLYQNSTIAGQLANDGDMLVGNYSGIISDSISIPNYYIRAYWYDSVNPPTALFDSSAFGTIGPGTWNLEVRITRTAFDKLRWSATLVTSGVATGDQAFEQNGEIDSQDFASTAHVIQITAQDITSTSSTITGKFARLIWEAGA